jgi:hypothetical protein
MRSGRPGWLATLLVVLFAAAASGVNAPGLLVDAACLRARLGDRDLRIVDMVSEAGYPRLVGYGRSWAEWGNREDLPLHR